MHMGLPIYKPVLKLKKRHLLFQVSETVQNMLIFKSVNPIFSPAGLYFEERKQKNGNLMFSYFIHSKHQSTPH